MIIVGNYSIKQKEEPLLQTGTKIKTASKKGNILKTARLSQQWQACEQMVMELYRENPSWSYEKIKQAAAKLLGVSVSCIRDHSKNPRPRKRSKS